MADGSSPVQGENFTRPASGTTIVSDVQYSGGKALRFDDDNAIATKQVTFSSDSVVIITARAGQTGGSPSLHLQVAGSNVQTRQIDSDTVSNYHFNNYVFQAGQTYTIGLKAKNTATGRKVHVDLVSFPVSSSQDLTPPETTITSSPSSLTNSTDAQFSFTSSETNSTFECSLIGRFEDGSIRSDTGWVPCTSPSSYSGLGSNGNNYIDYQFQVRATDAAGNVDATPADYTWRVDIDPPVISLTSDPGRVITSDTATFGFSAFDQGQSVATQCYLDGPLANYYTQNPPPTPDASLFSDCTSPKTYTGLTNGWYEFWVKATDPAGNTIVEVVREFEVTLP